MPQCASIAGAVSRIESHGDDRHFTMDDPRAAAASKISPMQAVDNIVDRLGTGGGRGG